MSPSNVDLTNNKMAHLKAILFDIDGTLCVGDVPIEGAQALLPHLRARGYCLRFLTNTTTKSHTQLLVQLQRLGFDIAPDELMTAPSVACLKLADIAKSMTRTLKIWPLVDDNIKADFKTFEWDESQPDYVVLGDIGEQWNLALINRLFNVLQGGAQLIALHKNRFWQTEQGLKADIGFFVVGLEYVSGKTALVMGKPNPDFFNQVLASVAVNAEQTLMVGDDIDSDVGGAQAMGILGALVRTGKFRQSYFEQSTIDPDFVLASVAELKALL